MRRPAFSFCALTLALATQAGGALAAESWVLPVNESSWRILKIPGERENQFTVQDDKLQIRSDASVSFRYYELQKPLPGPAQISWSWRVDAHSPLSSQTLKGRDDRPLAVHVWFDDTSEGSLFGGLGSILGYPKVGRLLTYVWGAREAAGSVLPNPHYDKRRLVVLVGDDGRTGEWQTIRRDIALDYRRAFGAAPDLSELRYVAVSADSDDLSGYSTAAIRSLSFHLP